MDVTIRRRTYVAICDTSGNRVSCLPSDVRSVNTWRLLINILLATLGARPLLKAEKPSSRQTRYNPWRAFP